MFQKIQNFIETTRQAMGSLFEIQPVDTRNLGIAENVEYGNSSNTKFARYLSLNARRAVNAFQGVFGVPDTYRAMTRELQQPIEQRYSKHFAHLGAKSIADYKKQAQALAKEWGDVQSEDDAKSVRLKTQIFVDKLLEYMRDNRPDPQRLDTVKSILAELDFEVIEGKQELWLKTEVQTPDAGLLGDLAKADPAVIDAFTKKLLGDRSGLTN
jgi:hypothetical protein